MGRLTNRGLDMLRLKSFFSLCLALAAALLVFVGCGNTAEREAVIVIDPEQRFQTMTGWELTADLAGNPQNPAWRP